MTDAGGTSDYCRSPDSRVVETVTALSGAINAVGMSQDPARVIIDWDWSLIARRIA